MTILDDVIDPGFIRDETLRIRKRMPRKSPCLIYCASYVLPLVLDALGKGCSEYRTMATPLTRCPVDGFPAIPKNIIVVGAETLCTHALSLLVATNPIRIHLVGLLAVNAVHGWGNYGVPAMDALYGMSDLHKETAAPSRQKGDPQVLRDLSTAFRNVFLSICPANNALKTVTFDIIRRFHAMMKKKRSSSSTTTTNGNDTEQDHALRRYKGFTFSAGGWNNRKAFIEAFVAAVDRTPRVSLGRDVMFVTGDRADRKRVLKIIATRDGASCATTGARLSLAGCDFPGTFVARRCRLSRPHGTIDIDTDFGTLDICGGFFMSGAVVTVQGTELPVTKYKVIMIPPKKNFMWNVPAFLRVLTTTTDGVIVISTDEAFEAAVNGNVTKTRNCLDVELKAQEDIAKAVIKECRAQK